MDVPLIGLIFAVLANTAALAWWASKLTANQATLTEVVKELKTDLKEHAEDDREFQLDIIDKLSSIKPSPRNSPNGGQH